MKKVWEVICAVFTSIYKGFKWVYQTYKLIKHNLDLCEFNSRKGLRDVINRMTGRQFEQFIYLLFKAHGYEAYLTPAANDYGKDLVVKHNHRTTYVECKRWFENGNSRFRVGRPELQKLLGAMYVDKADFALFITTGEYNENALEYAQDISNLTLWDMEDILDFVKELPKEEIPQIVIDTFEFKGELAYE